MVWNVFQHPESLGEVWHDMRFPTMGVKLAFTVFYIAALKPLLDSFGFYDLFVVGASSTSVGRRMFTA